MKLVTLSVDTPVGPVERLGALLGETHILDLQAAYARLLESREEPQPGRIARALLPADMVGFLEGGKRSLEAAREALAAMKAAGGAAARDIQALRRQRGPGGETLLYALSEARLQAPVPRPPALRDFLAFEEHAKQGAARRGEALAPEWRQIPAYYKGNHREIYGPDDEIPWPSYTRRLDFELEIGCVVGKKGRNLAPEEAARHIAGYTLLNDFSARDIQKREMAARMGPAKGKDFATALGPFLLTADEMPEPGNLALAVRVNGTAWSEGNFGARHWSFPLMLSHVSQEETVYPGDVLGSGTFYRGCGLDLDRWIEPGDVVEIEAEKLGVLRNRIGRPRQERHLDYSDFWKEAPSPRKK
ncbi:MAG: fumarylacetoacetate hydrolase family protein [Elusimicrobia bacterium]|nr:fumarylacetoacetate hydrolase family protein [Elusimicrobiota bacterium]